MLLAIDTSTEWIGLGLHDGVRVVSEVTWHSQNYHTVELVPSIAAMLERTHTSRSALSGLAVALGPGSFTGLRIGLSAVKGLALGLSLPAVGIPSLEILAASQPALRRPMIALLQVGRGRFAYQRFQYQKDQWVPQGLVAVDEPKAIAATITSPVYVVGEMGPEERRLFSRKWKTTRLAAPSACLRRPAVLAELAWQRLKAGQADDVVSLAPIYVHTLSNVPDV